MKNTLSGFSFFLLLSAFGLSAHADQFELWDGTKVEGEILLEENGQIIIETKNGLLNLPAFKVRQTLASEGPPQASPHQDRPPGNTLKSETLSSALKDRILTMHSDIEIYPDASIFVKETYKVEFVDKDGFDCGLKRKLILNYPGPAGTRKRADLKVIRTLKDAKEVRNRIDGDLDGAVIRADFCDGREFGPFEVHTYEISYRMDQQIDFLNGRDLFYWHITDQDREKYPVDEASAVIQFPKGSGENILSFSSFIGNLEYKNPEGVVEIDKANSRITLKAGRKLEYWESLSFLAVLRKGVISPPESSLKNKRFIRDNFGWILPLVFLPVLLFYYFIVWLIWGRDIPKGTIVPLFKAPDELSPSAVRYIYQMGDYDNRVLLAALIDLAVKGYLIIHQQPTGIYEIEIVDKDPQSLPAEEAEVLSVFRRTGSRIVISSHDYRTIEEARTCLMESLSHLMHKKYYERNTGIFACGVFITVVGIMGSSVVAFSQNEIGMMVVMSGFLGFLNTILLFIVSFLMKTLYFYWKYGRPIYVEKPMQTYALFAFLLSLGILMNAGFVSLTTPWFVLAISLLIIPNFIFRHLLKAPTKKGREVIDQIEGFKMFLETAEKDRLNVLNPADQIPQVFEKYLPYAFALDVEQLWSERFKDLMDYAIWGTTQQWYDGDDARGAQFASRLSSTMTDSMDSLSKRYRRNIKAKESR